MRERKGKEGEGDLSPTYLIVVVLVHSSFRDAFAATRSGTETAPLIEECVCVCVHVCMCSARGL